MRWIVLACVLVSAGCAQQQAQQPNAQIALKSREAIAVCQTEHPGTDPQERIKRNRCLSAAENRIYSGNRDSDLVAIRAALRVSLAEKIAKKQITEAEAQMQWAREMSKLKTTALNRNLAVKQVQAQSQAADAASLSSNLALIQQGAQMMQGAPRPSPIQTNCQRFMNQVNCTTY